MNARRRIALGEYVDDRESIDPTLYFQTMPPTQNNLKQPYTLKSIKNIKNNQVSINETSLTNSKSQLHKKRSRPRTIIPTQKTLNRKDLEHIQLPSDIISGVRMSQSLKQQQHNSKPIQRRARIDYRLKEIITKQKVTGLLSKFKNKIMRNNQYLEPIECNAFEAQQLKNFLQNQGFQIIPLLDNAIALLSIIQIALLFFMYTLSIVFSQMQDNYLLNFLQIFSIIFYFLQIAYNSITIKSTGGRRLKTYKQIIQNYFANSLVIDVMSLFIIVIDVNTNQYLMKYFRLFIVTKLPQCLQKMEKLEVFFIKTYHNQQYWSLVKVFLFNFCFAHILAIFLTAVAGMDPNNNWYSCKDIYNGTWFEKYVWGYYWGVNIMLTVGFGDIFATNYREALCLIFIECISVICLAYNINWVGTLISNIRAQDLQKSKNFKTFKQLTDKYQLPSEIQWKINNYIEQSVNIRKKFNIEQQHTFIKHLPQTLKKQYLQQSNKTIFQQLPFFGSLIDRTLYNFAEKIEMSISHPEQILKKIQDNFNLLILRQGSIGYMPKRRNCRSNGMVIDKVKIYDQQKPFILGLQFLTQRRPTYQIKSLQYSTLLSILKQSQMDYQHFCMLRDKNKSLIDQFEVLKCQNCKNQKHTKFICPRLHYIPIHQISIFKEQRLEKISKNPRVPDYDMRLQPPKSSALVNNRSMVELLRDGPYKNLQKTMVIQGGRRFENSFLSKLSQLKKIKDSSDSEGVSQDIKDVFLKNASQLIKSQFDRFFRKQSFEDQIWMINCDKMKNYKQYFAQSNPINLQLSFSLQQRLENMHQDQCSTDNIPNCHSLGMNFITTNYIQSQSIQETEGEL